MSMTSMTIGKRFIVTSGTLLALTALLAIISITAFQSIGKEVHSLATDSVPGLRYAYAMDVDIQTMRGDQLRQILSSDPTEIQNWEQHVADDHKNYDRDAKLYQQFMVDPTDSVNFSKLQPLLTALDHGWDNVVPLSRANKDVEALKAYVTEVRPNVLALGEQLTLIVDWNAKVADAGLKSTTDSAQTSFWLSVVTGLASILIGIGLSWYMVTTLNEKLTRSALDLTEGSEQVSSAATQVSASSQSLARDTSEQAAMIEETSASAEEINSMAKRNTESSHSASTLVVEAVKNTEQTNIAVDECVVAMNQISESSNKIAKTLQVIDKIAFQTNILALNAAVEAARAGEAGMGFAVVAEEVRNLAQRCAAASEEISLLIEQSLGNSDTGRLKMATLVESGAKVNSVFASLKVLVEEISLSSEEQSRGIEQIGRSIQKMEQGTQKSAANAEESAAAAEELNAQSEQLREVSKSLGAMVGLAQTSTSRTVSRRPTSIVPQRSSNAPKMQTYTPSAKLATVSSDFDDHNFTEF